MSAINWSVKPKGRAWLRSLPKEERTLFAKLGLSEAVYKYGNWWGIGGKARAASAARNEKGRFVKQNKEQDHE